jgi:hypothetical protein
VKAISIPMPLALAAAVALGALLPGRLFMLVLPPLALMPTFARELRAGRRGRAVRAALLWALLLSILTIGCVVAMPDRMAARILHGEAYRAEMFAWIETGEGREGDIRRFLPEHLTHFAALLAASFATGGLAALVLGCFLLNYMNFYVGSLLAASAQPWMTALFAWHLWSLVRVVGFVMAATAVGVPAYARFRRTGEDLRAGGPLLALGFVLVAADIILKFLLAEIWRGYLYQGLHG